MKKVVKTFKLRQSMSCADDPYDNAWAESFWSRLKAELAIPKGGYESIDKLKTINPQKCKPKRNHVSCGPQFRTGVCLFVR